MAARIQANVHQLVVEQRDEVLGGEATARLRVARLGGVSIPGDVDLDGRAIDRPEMEGAQIVAGGLHLDRAKAADEKVFEDLLEDGAEAVADVGLLQAAAQDLHALRGVRHILTLL